MKLVCTGPLHLGQQGETETATVAGYAPWFPVVWSLTVSKEGAVACQRVISMWNKCN